MVTNGRSCFLGNFTTLPSHTEGKSGAWEETLCSDTDPALKSDQGNGPLSVDAFVKIGNAVAL